MKQAEMYLSVLLMAVFFWPPSASAENPLDVKTLEISNTQNSDLLLKIAAYKNLEKLKIVCLEDLKTLPDDIGSLKNLKELNMDNGNGCIMNPQLPESLGNLSELRVLNLAGAQDITIVGETKKGPRRELPNSIAHLDNLETLDLSRNSYSEIPTVVSKLKHLKILRLNFNAFVDLPNWLNDTSITDISLGDNCRISGNEVVQRRLQKRFPKIKLNFGNEYDCN